MSRCPFCRQDMSHASSCTDAGYARLHDGPGRCHDCHVIPGALHHPGCLVARCATCGDQAQACREDGEHRSPFGDPAQEHRA